MHSLQEHDDRAMQGCVYWNTLEIYVCSVHDVVVMLKSKYITSRQINDFITIRINVVSIAYCIERNPDCQ